MCSNDIESEVFSSSIFIFSQNDYGKHDLYEGMDEVHETFDKRSAYKTGTGYGGYHAPPAGYLSSSSSSSSSSSGSGGGFNPAQSSSYSQSSSYGGYGGYNGYGGSNKYQQQPAVPLSPYGYHPPLAAYPGSQSAPYGQSSSGSNGRTQYVYTRPPPPAQAIQCFTEPKSILNALTKCSMTTNNCIVECINNYQFPNGQTKAKLLCSAGQWILENLDWTEKLACERK